MSQDYFAGGEWNYVCDICSRKLKSSKARFQWDGAITCDRCWSARHPQDFVRGVEDNQSIPWSRPAGDDQFTENIPGVTTTTVVVPGEAGFANEIFVLGRISRDTL